MKTLNIIFRSCANVKKASKGSNRPFNLEKEEIILKCLKSILESSKGFEKRIYLDIVDDSSPELFRNKIIKLLKKYKLNFNFHRINVKNNGKSMEYCYKLAEHSKQDIIYFCEDDYFHLKVSISSIFNAYDTKIIGNSKFAIHPTDYLDRYIHLEPSYIFAGKFNHYRSILSTTGTFIIPKKIYLKYKQFCYNFAKFNIKSTGGEEITINKIWNNVGRIPLIAPIESYAAHLNEDTLPPYINWKKEIEAINV